MTPLWKLALRILVVTMAGVVAVGVAAYVVLRNTCATDRPEIFLRLGHFYPVSSVAWSHDGRTLASGSGDTTVKLWDTSSGNLLRTFEGHSNIVTSVAWSPDGRTLASGSEDDTVKLWDIASGNLPRTLEGHSGSILSVAWSPDGRTLASGSKDNTVKLWDIASGNRLHTLEGHPYSVLSVAWSPDGRILASGSADNTIKLWDASAGKLLRTLEGHSDSVWSVAWSPDGLTLASSSEDTTVKLWHVASGQVLHTLKGHSKVVRSVAWNPSGRILTSSSDDTTVKLWDASSGTFLQTLEGHSDFVLSVAWSLDGRTLASGSRDTTIKLWGVSPNGLLRTLEGNSSSIRSVAWSPDGRILALGSDDATVKLWGSSSGNLLNTLEGHSDFVSTVAWSPDGRTLASGSEDATVKLWDISSGKLLRSLKGHSYEVSSVAWSPDGRTLASGSWDTQVNLWEASSGKFLRSLNEAPSREVLSVAWSPNGRILASGAGDGLIKFWDTSSGKLLRSFEGHSYPVRSVAWSPDGRILASGSEDDTIKLWDASSGKLLRSLNEHLGSVRSVAWSRDGILASASVDNTVKLWDASSGKLLRSLEPHPFGVTSVAWSPDGHTLASGSSVAFLWGESADPERILIARSRNVWLSYNPRSLFYAASPEGLRLAAVRFESKTRPVYPLAYFQPLLQQSDLGLASSLTPKPIEPQPFRLAWDSIEKKPLLAMSATALYLLGFTVVLVIAHRRSHRGDRSRSAIQETAGPVVTHSPLHASTSLIPEQPRNSMTILFPPPLIEALRSGKLALFVGSGASLGPDVKGEFPRWKALPQRLIDACARYGVADASFIKSKQDVFKNPMSLEEMLAELGSLRARLGRFYQAALSDIFRPQTLLPGAVHHAMARLGVRAIITTNYDPLIEEIREAPRRNPYTWKESSQALNDLKSDRHVLLKIHGTAEHADSVVMTELEYHRARADTSYQAVLSHLLQEYTFLFLGYGMNDPLDLDLVLKWNAEVFKSATRRHYTLMQDPRSDDSDRYARDYNVQVISYHDHAYLPEVLDELQRVGAMSPGRVLGGSN